MCSALSLLTYLMPRDKTECSLFHMSTNQGGVCFDNTCYLPAFSPIVLVWISSQIPSYCWLLFHVTSTVLSYLVGYLPILGVDIHTV